MSQLKLSPWKQQMVLHLKIESITPSLPTNALFFFFNSTPFNFGTLFTELYLFGYEFSIVFRVKTLILMAISIYAQFSCSFLDPNAQFKLMIF